MSSKKSSSKSKERKEKSDRTKGDKNKDKTKSKKSKKLKTPSPEPEPEPEEVYEDDFEDYEDDFEDVEEEESQQNPEVKTKWPNPEEKKIEQSKDESIEEDSNSNLIRRLSRAQYNQSIIPKSTQSKAPAVQHIPTFSVIDNKPYTQYNEEERRSVENRGYERLQKLRGLISIETTKSVVFTDLSSNIFEPFQALPSHLSHAFTQTANDAKSEEVQTELGDVETKETQFPHMESSYNSTANQRETTPADRARFKKFFFAAVQTIREILINDDQTVEAEETREKTIMKFSRGYNSFQLGAVSQKCRASYVTSGEIDSVLIAFEIFETPAQDLVNKSLIVEFYIHRRRPPKRLFVVESVVSSMILSSRSQVLYVALKDGTLCAFDLSIADTYSDDFLPWVDSDNDIPLRRPTFDSSFLVTTLSDASPLVGLACSQNSTGEDITTVDSSGTVSYWLAARTDKNELSVQLTAVIRPHPVMKRQSNSFAISAFCFIQSPPRFFIGTDTGALFSMYKSDASQAIPKVFKTEKEKYGEITSISVNPSDSSFLIVGFSSGALSLYRTTQISPMLNFPKTDLTNRVTCVMWSCSNDSAFYSIHGGKTIMFWDISHQLTPKTTDTRHEPGQMLAADIWQTKGSSISYMGISLDTGETEVHVLETPRPKNQNEKLIEIVNRIKHL